MSGRNVQVDRLADVVMEGLNEYADLASKEMKSAVKKAGNTVKKEIRTNAPKDTGAYAKSWTVKKIKETSDSLALTVHSKNRYQIAHLLEKGHVKRGGGRTEAKPHIAPAEQKGEKQLMQDIERGLRNG